MLTPLDPVDGEAILPLATLKRRIRVLSTDEDSDIERMRAQAISFVEVYSGIALSRRAFRWSDKQFCRAMNLPVGPLVSVEAIEYTDTTGVTVELSDWYVGTGSVSPLAGQSWPFASGQDGAVRIDFTAGLEDAEAEAPMLIAAVEVGVAALRASRDKPDWSGAMACADQHRMPGL